MQLVICLDVPGETMLTWLPPSPPLSDAEDDLYYDSTGEYWFEQLPMEESRLPATIHELHRPRPLAAPAMTAVPEQHLSDTSVTETRPKQKFPGTSVTTAEIPFAPAVTSGTTSLPVAASYVSSVSQERGVSFIPSADVSSYPDASSMLRPETPSHIPGSVEDAIDSVRKSAQKAFSGERTPHSPSFDIIAGGLSATSSCDSLIQAAETSNFASETATLCAALTDVSQMPNHLRPTKSGIYSNWDFVSYFLGISSDLYRSVDAISLRISERHETKLTEFGVRYQCKVSVYHGADCQSERTGKSREQDKERVRLRDEEEEMKDATIMDQQRKRDQKVTSRKAAIPSLLGVVRYQKTDYDIVIENAQRQLATVIAPRPESSLRAYAVINLISLLVSTPQPNVAESDDRGRHERFSTVVTLPMCCSRVDAETKQKQIEKDLKKSSRSDLKKTS
ncbi:unnamed protein product [Gongylonema pulchrum]|uniref:Uncharacterized protein n=1 Tax=Gongylonema pulchrum TaxID=637853 RepID=A0A183DWL8_9BILA|nr:unnamed protein product [Gongylonema pulchrum]